MSVGESILHLHDPDWTNFWNLKNKHVRVRAINYIKPLGMLSGYWVMLKFWALADYCSAEGCRWSQVWQWFMDEFIEMWPQNYEQYSLDTHWIGHENANSFTLSSDFVETIEKQLHSLCPSGVLINSFGNMINSSIKAIKSTLEN